MLASFFVLLTLVPVAVVLWLTWWLVASGVPPRSHHGAA
jgi:hypothetical protein